VTPKVELHLHLEGAVPPPLVRDLARARGTDLARLFDARGRYRFRGFRDFLRVYEAAAAVLATPADYARATAAVLDERAGDGVIYLEAFLSPDFCGGGDLGAWRDHVAAIAEAARTRAPAIELRAIVTCIRHFGPARARAVARAAAETAGAFVTGFGLAGDETAGRAADFAWAFDCAREAGLGLTAHAGEWAGPASIRAALEDLGVSRIGHGVRAIEDPTLVEHLAERGVVLEICPASNLALGLFPDYRRHPVGRLLGKGVGVTLATDDPPFFAASLERDYAALADAFGWDAGVFAAINATAARAAFCDGVTRAAILKRLETAP